MPPKRDYSSNSNNNNNVEMSSTVGSPSTVTITVSSTSNNNNINSNENSNSSNTSKRFNNNYNNNNHSNTTLITSLVTRSATAAMTACNSSSSSGSGSGSSNTTTTNLNNNNNSANVNNNNHNNNITTMAMADNGNNNNQSLYANDAAAEQRPVAYQANSKLCRLVRKCPWMYDRTHRNYAKKHVLDKSWTKIAKECNDSVVSCKERWRNIRAAFARSINIYKTHSGPNRVKPYYLHKELTFLVRPMMEGRDKKDELEEDIWQDMETNGDDEMDVTEVTKEDGDDDDEELDQEDDEQEDQDEADEAKSDFEAFKPAITIHTDEYSLKSNTRSLQDKIYNNNNNNNNNNNHHQHQHQHQPHNNYDSNSLYDQQTEIPSTSDAEGELNFSNNNNGHDTDRQLRNCINLQKRPMYAATELQCDAKRTHLMSPNNLSVKEADIRFLEAILPDMALMNTRQKIIFKRKLYQTLEEVFENTTNFSCYQQSSQSGIPQTQNHLNNGNFNSIQTNSGNNNMNNQHKNNNNANNNIANNNNNNNNNNNSNNNVMLSTATPSTTVTSVGLGNQVKQTILTVNSSMARSLISNIAQLNESELQKVSAFVQTYLRNNNVTGRLTNSASSAAAHLMHSTPKITITKVTCPPPTALRNFNANSTGGNNCSQQGASPSATAVFTPIVSTSALGTQTIVHSTGIINPNVHSTTTINANMAIATSSVAAATATPTINNTRFQMVNNLAPSTSNTITNNNSHQNGFSGWNQLVPITIKDEIEDVDID